MLLELEVELVAVAGVLVPFVQLPVPVLGVAVGLATLVLRASTCAVVPVPLVVVL